MFQYKCTLIYKIPQSFVGITDCGTLQILTQNWQIVINLAYSASPSW